MHHHNLADRADERNSVWLLSDLHAHGPKALRRRRVAGDYQRTVFRGRALYAGTDTAALGRTDRFGCSGAGNHGSLYDIMAVSKHDEPDQKTAKSDAEHQRRQS